MTNSLETHVDESAEAMARRFIDAWHRAEQGEAVDEHQLSFESWAGLASVLTPRRLEVAPRRLFLRRLMKRSLRLRRAQMAAPRRGRYVQVG